MTDSGVIRIKPFQYVHVLDNNTNVTRVITGPSTYTRAEHEKIVAGPEQMVMIPPRHYCVIQNPIVRVKPDVLEPVLENGNAKLRHGDEEIRREQDPFPLYPGEIIVGGAKKINPLQVVAPNSALRLRCIRDFTDEADKSKYNAGDEWLFPGPGTYIPRIEVQVVEILKATIIKKNQALKLRARKACYDFEKKERKAGEEWLVRTPGAYLPGVDEEIVETVNGHVLTVRKALQLRAKRTFDDVFEKKRLAGEEWLVTFNNTEVHIPDVYEEVVGEVRLTTLTNRQYCVILDPISPKTGKPAYGTKEVRKGEISFFLHPGERLEQGIQNIHVLAEEEALLLRAREEYNDGKENHKPGDRWMVKGPCDYVPPTAVEILERRVVIPLDENEGIYVRDTKTGKVRSVVGQSYMLQPNEELWQKDLPKVVEDLLAKERAEVGESQRDKTRVVTFRAPHNSAVQIYDYKDKASRIIWGPGLVMLQPDEHFTVLSLSGDKPKRPHVIKSLCLFLGPDFMTDIVTVETSDHARLSLKVSYNWHFEVTEKGPTSSVFQVPDFVGDACKAIASRVRGAVAAASFDSFHKNSARIIRAAVFGTESVGEGDKKKEKIKNYFKFQANGMVITNIDIQSVEPVDQRTRDSLQKSVQLAIEITTKSQEADAKHDAEKQEQEAKGRLERQKINDEAEAEKARRSLLQLQAESAIVETSGQATAEARARADAAEIEGASSVELAKLKADANQIINSGSLKLEKSRHESEIAHKTALMNIELEKARELATIEARKFNDVVDAIGSGTIKAIAQAGPELQLRLLQGLGLKSFLITDGNSPVNLFGIAKGLVENEQ